MTRITINIPDSLLIELKKHSKENGLSTSATASKLIEQGLSRNIISAPEEHAIKLTMQMNSLLKSMAAKTLGLDNDDFNKLKEMSTERFKELSGAPERTPNHSSDSSGNPYLSPGRQLRNLRKKSGLKQEELAKKLNISQPNLSSMENGQRLIGLEMAHRIAHFFGENHRIFLGL